MDITQIAHIMDQFEQRVENIEVASNVMEQSLSNVYFLFI